MEMLVGADTVIVHAVIVSGDRIVATFGLEKVIGSLEVGKKADLVLHDTDRPEWRPLLNVANQLVWSAYEAKLHEQAQMAAQEVTKRSGLPFLTTWSVQ